jgi:hypothetical protein
VDIDGNSKGIWNRADKCHPHQNQVIEAELGLRTHHEFMLLHIAELPVHAQGVWVQGIVTYRMQTGSDLADSADERLSNCMSVLKHEPGPPVLPPHAGEEELRDRYSTLRPSRTAVNSGNFRRVPLPSIVLRQTTLSIAQSETYAVTLSQFLS